MVPVQIHSLSLDATTNQPVVILRDPESGKLLPIWIGQNEASAILLKVQGIEPPRPMTHDLLYSVVGELGYVLERVEITRLEESTFYAALVLRGEEHSIAVDARPSDSLALAVRANAPVFVAEEVMETAGLLPEDTVETVDEDTEVEAFREFIENVNPEDFQS
jgi:bifunctional DNase/RNase